MNYQRVIKTTLFCIVVVFIFIVKAHSGDTELNFISIAPLTMNNESHLVLKQNAYSTEYNQVWYSVWDTRDSSIDDVKEYSVSLIKYLDKDYAVDEFEKLVEVENFKIAASLNEDVEFCGYRLQKLKGMKEDTIFIYLGMNGSYFMMMGKKKLVFKAFDINNYCDINT
ncbi:hypothetical protein [Agarivorans sp. QJM3NY_33]